MLDEKKCNFEVHKRLHTYTNTDIYTDAHNRTPVDRHTKVHT